MKGKQVCIFFIMAMVFYSCSDSKKNATEQKIIDHNTEVISGSMEIFKNDNEKDSNATIGFLSEAVTAQILEVLTVSTTEELLNEIGSNKVIELLDKQYVLPSTLLLDSITNLDIVGTGSSTLSLIEKNASVVKMTNSQDIRMVNLIIGHSVSPGFGDEHGVINMSHSNNVVIDKCKLMGAGTFGLITNNVKNFILSNSEITACSGLIFELSKSKKCVFRDSKFQNNNLGISVLGGFTNGTKKVVFTNCEFLNNKPKESGNPVFNFNENHENLEDQILFENCNFKNNPGYKWWGDKIELINCNVDTADFIGFR